MTHFCTHINTTLSLFSTLPVYNLWQLGWKLKSKSSDLNGNACPMIQPWPIIEGYAGGKSFVPPFAAIITGVYWPVPALVEAMAPGT
jgi:hypothetical protein